MDLITEKKKWSDEELKWFSVWIKSGTYNRCEEADEGAEKIEFGIGPLSGAEVEKVGNKSGGSQNMADLMKGDVGTMSIEYVASVVKRIKGVNHPDGNPVEKVNVTVVRGLPDWMIIEVTDHLEVVKKKEEDEEKN